METKEKIDELAKAAVFAELDGIDYMWSFTTAEMQRAYNGIGPEFLPEGIRAKVTDFLGLFAPAALIHDLRFERSDGLRFMFNFANAEFRDNCIKLADAEYPWWRPRRYAARACARIMYDFVSGSFGWRAWCEAKDARDGENDKGVKA